MKATTTSLEESVELGRRLGRAIRTSMLIALRGELGAGKTAFVKGLARGLDVPEDQYVTSPTYTLINEYSGRTPLFHVDLYRLESYDDFENIGLFDILAQKGVIAMEWPERMGVDLPDDRLDIRFEISGKRTRIISLTPCGHKAKDLLQELADSQAGCYGVGVDGNSPNRQEKKWG